MRISQEVEQLVNTYDTNKLLDAADKVKAFYKEIIYIL